MLPSFASREGASVSNLAITWAWQARVGDPAAKLVLMKLADQANDDGICWPSQRTLSEHLEMPERTLRRKLEILTARHLIEVVRRANRSNVYKLALDGSANLAGTAGMNGSATAMAAEPSEDLSSSPEHVASDEATNSSEAAATTKISPNEIVTEYVDQCIVRGVPRLGRTVQKLGGIAKRELAAHPEIPPGAWMEATGRVAAGRPPEMLTELAVEAMGRKPELRPDGRTTVEEEAKRRVSEGLARGWPTGAVFHRGSHSGGLHYDPWGRDPITETDWRHARPSYKTLLDYELEQVKAERSAL
jgi:Helix-turn-helix domain